MGMTDCSWMYIAILDKIVYTFSKPCIYQAFKINKMSDPTPLYLMMTPCVLGVIAICGLIQDFVDFVCDVVNDCLQGMHVGIYSTTQHIICHNQNCLLPDKKRNCEY